MTKEQQDRIVNAIVAELGLTGTGAATQSQVRKIRAGVETALGKPTKKPKPESQSRTARWSRAASAAVSALESLKEVQDEFSEWRDNLPENLQNSGLGEKLNAVCDIDIESAVDAASEAEGADLPLGFGRD